MKIQLQMLCNIAIYVRHLSVSGEYNACLAGQLTLFSGPYSDVFPTLTEATCGLCGNMLRKPEVQFPWKNNSMIGSAVEHGQCTQTFVHNDLWLRAGTTFDGFLIVSTTHFHSQNWANLWFGFIFRSNCGSLTDLL